MRQLGFDNPATDFKAQTPDDAQDMKTALLDEKVPLNHVAKIMRSASALRPSTSSASPLDPRLEPVLWSNPIPADGMLQRVEPTWAHPSLSMTVPTSAGQCALVQSSRSTRRLPGARKSTRTRSVRPPLATHADWHSHLQPPPPHLALLAALSICYPAPSSAGLVDPADLPTPLICNVIDVTTRHARDYEARKRST